MKNLISLSVALVMVFGVAATSFAATDCSVTACGNGDPGAVTQAWGLTGHETPSVAPGVTVTDEHGVSDVCPVWFGQMGCSDITRTQYYRDAMTSIVRQLISLGYSRSAFPTLAGWYDTVK